MADRPGVRATYERIADHFSATREHPWPDVESFCADRSADTALDIGCGNGRHTALLADRSTRTLGLDASRSLLSIARDRVPDAAFIEGDAASLPIAAQTVDLALYVATLHHLPDRRLRIRSLDELARVLTPDGTALISVWSTTHDRFDTEDESVGFDTDVEWTLPGGETVPRFYHIYAPEEFESDLDESDLSIVESFLAMGNCYAVVESE